MSSHCSIYARSVRRHREQRRDGLIRLSRDVWQSGWWDNYSEDLSLNIVDYAWLESRAQRIRSFDAFVIPGLLQTREYMDAMIRPTADPEQVDRWIKFRQTRQQVLTMENAPNLIAVLDEATVRRRIGGSEIMRDQLARLVASANRTNIEIRVLPLSAGAHASPDGAFRIFELPGPYPTVAYVPSPAGAIGDAGRGPLALAMGVSPAPGGPPGPSVLRPNESSP